MSEEKTSESRTENQGSAEGKDPIQARTERLIDQGCRPDLAHMAGTVAEMYLTCFLAAKDVLDDKRILETIGYTDVKYKLQAADTIMGKISVSFRPDDRLIQASGIPIVGKIEGLPAGHPLAGGRTG